MTKAMPLFDPFVIGTHRCTDLHPCDLVADAALADRFCPPHRNAVVDVCSGRLFCGTYCASDGGGTGGAGSGGESGAVFKKGIGCCCIEFFLFFPNFTRTFVAQA